MSKSVLDLREVHRTYHLSRDIEVAALRGVSLACRPGELVAIVGPSGSGKTTLLNIAGLLDHADSGDVVIDGRPTASLKDAERTAVRRSKIGFVFQSFNLLPHLTAVENVGMPLRYVDGAVKPRSPAGLLEEVGLGERLDHRPDQLSGGEQQRVAIARALVCDPPILLCDEPTGELDSETAAGVHELLLALRDSGKSLVIVTHNEELARIADRSVHMRDGLITDDARRRSKPRSGRKKAGARRTRGTSKKGPSVRQKAAARTTRRSQ